MKQHQLKATVKNIRNLKLPNFSRILLFTPQYTGVFFNGTLGTNNAMSPISK